METKDLLLEMAKIELDEARQYEAQRERLVTLAVIVTGGLVTAFSLQTEIIQFKSSLAVFGILLNGIVLGLSWKFYSQFKIRYERYRIYRKTLSDLHEGIDVEKVNEDAKSNWHGRRGYGVWDAIPLRWAWLAFPTAMLLASILMLIALLNANN